MKGQKRVVITVELPKALQSQPSPQAQQQQEQQQQEQRHEQQSDSSVTSSSAITDNSTKTDSTESRRARGLRWIFQIFSGVDHRIKESAEDVSSSSSTEQNTSSHSMNLKDSTESLMDIANDDEEKQSSSTDLSLLMDNRDDFPSNLEFDTIERTESETGDQDEESKNESYSEITDKSEDKRMNSNENVILEKEENDSVEKCVIHSAQHESNNSYDDKNILATPNATVINTTPPLPPQKDNAKLHPGPITINNHMKEVSTQKSTPTKPQTLKEIRRKRSMGSKKFIHVFHNQLTTLKERPSVEDCDSDNESMLDIQQIDSRGRSFDERELRNRWNYSLQVMARVATQKEEKERMRE